MRVRKLWAPLLILVAIGLVATAVFLRRLAPPEPARLLPESDGIVYVNAGLIRRFVAIPQANIQREPEYDDFVRSTGFEFERDLDEAALALHLPGKPGGPARFSHIISGKFDRGRAVAYLKRVAKGTENYREHDIYLIEREDRTLRITILSGDTVAASNADDAGVIRGIVERYQKSAMPFSGPAMLREYYRHVPFAAPVWSIVRVPGGGGPNPLQAGNVDLVGMLQQFAGGTTLVASLRYTGSVDLKAEAFTGSDPQAEKLVARFRTFLDLYRSFEKLFQPAGPDPDVKAFIDSIEVRQDDSRAVFTATLSEQFLKKTFAPAAEQAAPAPEAAPEKK